MKIGIIGAGAVGSLFAARLAETAGNQVICAVRRQEQADDINANGISILEDAGGIPAAGAGGQPETGGTQGEGGAGAGAAGGAARESGTLRALVDTSAEAPADMVLVAVKAGATETAVEQHRALIGPDTVVVTLQNGYGNHKALLKVTDPAHIVIGTTGQGVNIREDGTIVHAGNGPTTIGPLAGDAPEAAKAAEQVAQALRGAGFEVRMTSDAEDAVFRKLFINIGINALCALADANNGVLLRDRQLQNESRGLVFEAVQVVNDATGRKYDADEIWTSVYDTFTRTERNFCSMVQDVRKRRPTEIRRINGAVAELAKEAGLEAPLNRMITEEIELRFGK